MSETLKTGGEKSQENTEASRLKVLTNMSDKFDPKKAKSLAEKDEAKNQKPLYQLTPKFPPQNPKRNLLKN